MEAADNDQKKLWKSLTEITGYKELDREDTTEISVQSLADMLKAHMSSPQPPMESAHPAPETTTGPSFEIQQVSVEAVKIALQNIDTNKATGIDALFLLNTSTVRRYMGVDYSRVHGLPNQ